MFRSQEPCTYLCTSLAIYLPVYLLIFIWSSYQTVLSVRPSIFLYVRICFPTYLTTYPPTTYLPTEPNQDIPTFLCCKLWRNSSYRHISFSKKNLWDEVIANFTFTAYCLLVGVGVLLAADSQSTSSSGYRASLWDPWPDFILLFFLRLTIT
jgi:hypothetical protein